jgi:hypothetical protein
VLRHPVLYVVTERTRLLAVAHFVYLYVQYVANALSSLHPSKLTIVRSTEGSHWKEKSPFSSNSRLVLSERLIGSLAAYAYRFMRPTLKRRGSLVVHLPVIES